MRTKKMKYPSSNFMEEFDKELAILADSIAKNERESCADLVQQLADGEEDQVRKDLLNDVATAIRRIPPRKYR